MMSRRVAPSTPQDVNQLGLDRSKAGGDVDHDREEREQERCDDRGHGADTEPDDEDRNDAAFGTLLNAIRTG